MKFHRLQVMIFGAALLTVPAVLLAQDPMSPMSPSNPMNGDPANNQQQSQNAAMQPGSQRTQQSSDLQDSAGAGPMDPEILRDKQFVREAGEGGIGEIELAKLALQKSGNEGVKTFAQKMIDDHTMLDNTMRPLAEQIGVMPPRHMGKADQAEFDRLSKLSANDFDREYIALMVKEHRKDLHDFRVEAMSTQDPALKDNARKGARVIRGHLTMAEKLATANGVTVPPKEARGMK